MKIFSCSPRRKRVYIIALAKCRKLLPMPASPPLDLTGQVRKTQAYYFANGGVADIWMGEWLQDNTRKIVQ
jgi:hypothetical protein